jgi:WhiB family redox-sensing transcriptional regulator
VDFSAILVRIMEMTRQQAFTEFSHAQADIEDRGGTLACREKPDFFYPEDYFEAPVRKIAETLAKELCLDCPLVALCKSYAVLAQEDYGIWGGTNARERRELRAFPRP